MLRKTLLVVTVFVFTYFINNLLYAQEVADKFDYPFKPVADYETSQKFLDYYDEVGYGKYHLAEDWVRNDAKEIIGNNTYVIANGVVTLARSMGTSWGKTIIIRHTLPDGSHINSMYSHLERIDVYEGQIITVDPNVGWVIGTIGDADRKYVPHLHFELRTDESMEKNAGHGYIVDLTNASTSTDR